MNTRYKWAMTLVAMMGLTAGLMGKNTDNVLDNLIKVEGGEFEMGSIDGQLDEKPIHLVQVDSFYLSKYEVTVAEFVDFLNSTGTEYPMTSEPHAHIYGNKGNYYVRKGEEHFPVVYVSWDDAQNYIQWLNQSTGRNFRLPTEAEWEYAARGGKKTKGYRYSGSDNIDRIGWYHDNSEGSTRPVGKKSANELGLKDMSGNVWEWCSDYYEASYYQKAQRSNPRGPETGTSGVNRGGCWNGNTEGTRCTYRIYNDPGDRLFIIGFRLAMNV